MKAYCDICESDVVVKGKKGEQVSLHCTSCEQIWVISNNEATCIILKCLWPSNMREDSKMYREEYLPSWLKKKQHYAVMMFVSGFWSETEKNDFLRGCDESYEQWFEDHQMPWWKFWK